MLRPWGYAGTGKTCLVCCVIDQLVTFSPRTGRMAFIFFSNDKANLERKETLSRSDPEEAVKSIVSQLTTTQVNN